MAIKKPDNRTPKKSAAELKEIARAAIRVALEGYFLSDEIKNKLALIIGKDDDPLYTVCELFVPGERPQLGITISRAWVNDVTGEVRVEVYL